MFSSSRPLTYGIVCLSCTVLLGACGPTPRHSTGAMSAAWLDAPLLAADNEWGAFDHHEARDAQGNTLAVWEQFDGQRFNIWANRKIRGQGWGVAQLIEVDNAGSAYNPRVAVDSLGNGVAVWQQHDGTRTRVVANRYMQGTGWSQAQWIDGEGSHEAHAPQVDFDNQGQAVAVWQHKVGHATRVATNRLTAQTGWGTATTLDQGMGYASAPQLGHDAQGQLISLWQVQNKQGTSVHASRHLAGAGWSNAQWVHTLDAKADYPPTGWTLALK